MCYTLQKQESSLKSFQDDCSNDKILRRLKLIKVLIILALFGSIIGLSGSTVLGGSSVVLELLVIWYLNDRIAYRKRIIKEQYLPL